MDVSSFTGFDIAVLVVLGLSVVFGLTRGLVTEVLALLSWAGAVLVTLFGFVWASDLAREYIAPEVVADIIAGLTLFFGSLIALKFVAGAIGRTVRQSSIGALDRSLGALFGLARGALVVAALYLLYSAIVPIKQQPDWVKGAQLRPLVFYGSEMLAVLSSDLLDRAQEEGDTREILEDMKAKMPTPTDFVDEENVEGYADDLRQKLDDTIRDLQTSTPDAEDKSETEPPR